MPADHPRLRELGWTSWHARHYRQAMDGDAGHDAGRCQPARALTVIRHLSRLVTEDGEVTAFLPGKMRATAPPVVGDWLVLEAPEGVEPVVREVLPRRTKLSRKVAGPRTAEQVLAANLDTVFLVMGLDGDFNLRRLERLIVVARQSGAEPVVVLTKSDLVTADELERRRDEVAGVAPGVSVHAVSSPQRQGLEPLRFYLSEGQTVVLLGSSGAGKSTLLNTLVGSEVMRTGAVRESDDTGRHTTSHRELVPLPGGGLLIDGPGIREVQLWVDEDDESLEETFADVEELAQGCRFSDCTHRHEPGCAVQAAIESGTLDAARMESYRALQHELNVLARRKDVAADRKFFKKQGAYLKRILAEKKDRM